nr:replication initiator protein A [uncultured Blautia sp.]
MMSNQDYMPVECLLVPKALFKDERYCSLSTTAKVLYSLMLDRLKYAAQNRWVDQKGKLYVIYPKSEMIRDLNSTRYRVDYAVSELESMGNMVRVVKDNGRPNRFYINDISKNEEENAMMTIKDLMEMVTPEEAEEIMDKMVATAREIVDDLMKKGYIEIIRESCPEGGHLEDGVPPIDLGEDEFNPEDLSPMEFRCYCDENGILDDEAIEDDASEFGMDLAFGVIELLENDLDRIEAIRQYFNYVYKMKSMKKFMAVVETTAVICGNSPEWIEDMHACNKGARRIYLKELVNVFNMYLDMFKNKEME